MIPSYIVAICLNYKSLKFIYKVRQCVVSLITFFGQVLIDMLIKLLLEPCLIPSSSFLLFLLYMLGRPITFFLTDKTGLSSRFVYIVRVSILLVVRVAILVILSVSEVLFSLILVVVALKVL